MRWRGGAEPVTGVRPPAVAGQFYSARPERLAAEVDRYVAEARAAMPGRAGRGGRAGSAEVTSGGVGGVGGVGGGRVGRLVAVVAPHAGHVYSGPTAGFAYGVIDPGQVRRVVLLGPAHYVPVDGIGLSSASAWRTPLGDVPLDAELGADLRARFDSVAPADVAHGPEHSLEVQLPFLQRVLDPGWVLVPLIVGLDLPEEIAAVIDRCAALPETLVVVSTDLSHYLDHDTAAARDARTIEAVVGRRAEEIGPHDACGRYPLRGLVLAAQANDWTVSLLDARNSGDTAGGWDRVVGYAAFAVRAPDGAGAGEGSAGDEALGAVDLSGGSRTDAGDAPSASAAAGGEGLDAAPSAADDRRLSAVDRRALLGLARQAIETGLDTGRRTRIDLADWPGPLREPGAAFVTLRSSDGELLGCIGSLQARQPLVDDIAEHAFDAAFRDPRFPPLTREWASGMVIDVSVLTAPEPFPCSSYAQLLAEVPVGSGVTVTSGRHRATFLPAVWAQLPEPATFLAALWRKAGLQPGDWPAGTRIEVYDSEEFAETDVERV